MSARARLRILSVLLGSLAALITARADPVADFYAGKTITLIISTGVGGGIDTNARVLARHLGAHIPGNPLVVPKNMAGAGHLLAANFLHNAAPRDGTHIGAVLPAFVGYQILDGKGAQYDARNFNFLGATDVENANFYTWSALGLKSVLGARSREALMGATGAGSYTALYPALLNNTLGTKFKIVSGYRSTNEIHLAMERGEVQGRAGNFFTSLKSQNPGWLRDKKIDMLLQIGAARDPEWPDVPLLTDLAENAEQRQIFSVFSAETALGKVFITTPGVPRDRLAALRKAFEETLRDPAFLEDARRVEMLTRPLGWQQAKALADEILALPEDIVRKARAAMEIRPGDERKAPAD